jgi:hypothetical protein
VTKFIFSSSSTMSCGSHWIFCLALLAIAGGCGSNNQRLTQLQNENDRLLAEYRAQRSQVTQLNEKLALAQNRLAESEKLLARQSPLPASRLSRLNDPSSLSTTPTFGSTSRGAVSGSSPAGLGSTASASKPNTAGSESNASAASDLYWRPMRREAP